MKMKHVLLIDDNDMDNYISNHIISKNNLAEKISIKTSAMDALEYLNNLQANPKEFPNLIFLDIRMPAMDGFDFLEEFIKFPQAVNKQCDVVMLTSSSDQNDINRASQYPVVKKYLNKPLEISMLENL
ncbi:MAG TPA: response regulator [Bacteroidia bacterium]|nr:response regulator [Bacteroidia bacterium]